MHRLADGWAEQKLGLIQACNLGKPTFDAIGVLATAEEKNWSIVTYILMISHYNI